MTSTTKTLFSQSDIDAARESRDLCPTCGSVRLSPTCVALCYGRYNAQSSYAADEEYRKAKRAARKARR